MVVSKLKINSQMHSQASRICCYWKNALPDGFGSEFKHICHISLPIILTGIAEFMIAPISIMFCGRLGSIELAAAGMAISIFQVSGIAIVMGLLTASDTLFSQTFGGNIKHFLGVQVQKTCVIMLFCLMPCWAIHTSIQPIMLAAGIEPIISKMTSKYVLAMIPGLLFVCSFQILTKYVQVQNNVYPPFFACLFGNICNALMHYLLIYKTNFGIVGSAIAQDIAFFCQSAFLLIYICALKLYKTTWNGVKSEMLLDWGIWFRLAIPGLVMVGFDSLVCESGNLLSVYLGNEALAAQTILNSVASIVYFLVPKGVGMATTIRVGQFLGGGKSEEPQVTVHVALITSVASGIITTIILTGLCYEIPKLFSINEDVIQLTASHFPVIIVFQFFDGIKGIICGVISGAGLQTTGAIVGSVCMYLIGAPIGLCLMLLTSVGISGFWWGILIGTVLQVLSCSVILFKLDWNKQTEKALKRTEIHSIAKDRAESCINSQHIFEYHIVEKNNANSNEDRLVKTRKLEETKTARLTWILLCKRLSFVLLLLAPLIASILCYFLLDLSDFFPAFCQLKNNTIIEIPSFKARLLIPKLYAFINENCTDIFP